MKLLLLSHDLMIVARVEGAARKLGLTMVTVRDQQAAIDAASDGDSQVLIVDLRLPDLSLEDLVEAVAVQAGTPIVACAPHVHKANLSAAREAGCDAVVTRGELDRGLETILGELLAK